MPPFGINDWPTPSTLETKRVTFAEGLLLSTTAVAPAMTKQEPHLGENCATTAQMLAVVTKHPTSKGLLASDTKGMGNT